MHYYCRIEMKKQLISVKLVYRCRRCNEVFTKDPPTTIDKGSILKDNSQMQSMIHDCQFIRTETSKQSIRIVSFDRNAKAFGIAELVGYDLIT